MIPSRIHPPPLPRRPRSEKLVVEVFGSGSLFVIFVLVILSSFISRNIEIFSGHKGSFCSNVPFETILVIIITK